MSRRSAITKKRAASAERQRAKFLTRDLIRLPVAAGLTDSPEAAERHEALDRYDEATQREADELQASDAAKALWDALNT